MANEISNAINEYVQHFELYKVSEESFISSHSREMKFISLQSNMIVIANLGILRCRSTLGESEQLKPHGKAYWKKNTCIFSGLADVCGFVLDKVNRDDFEIGWVNFCNIFPHFKDDPIARDIWPFAHAMAVAWDKEAKASGKPVTYLTPKPLNSMWDDWHMHDAHAASPSIKETVPEDILRNNPVIDEVD